jgi:hypothetical protein
MQFEPTTRWSIRSRSKQTTERNSTCQRIFTKIINGGINNKHPSMDTSAVYTLLTLMLGILTETEHIERPHMKPSDYIALHLLNCVICAITIGVLYNVYFG